MSSRGGNNFFLSVISNTHTLWSVVAGNLAGNLAVVLFHLVYSLLMLLFLTQNYDPSAELIAEAFTLFRQPYSLLMLLNHKTITHLLSS